MKHLKTSIIFLLIACILLSTGCNKNSEQIMDNTKDNIENTTSPIEPTTGNNEEAEPNKNTAKLVIKNAEGKQREGVYIISYAYKEGMQTSEPLASVRINLDTEEYTSLEGTPIASIEFGFEGVYITLDNDFTFTSEINITAENPNYHVEYVLSLQDECISIITSKCKNLTLSLHGKSILKGTSGRFDYNVQLGEKYLLVMGVMERKGDLYIENTDNQAYKFYTNGVSIVSLDTNDELGSWSIPEPNDSWSVIMRKNQYAVEKIIPGN